MSALPVQAAHYVFAHYMVCYALYGQTIDGYRNELRDAQAAGIDGFALNVGEWNGPDTYYKTRVELIYQAAESLTNGFKLFFSVDNMTNSSDVVQMVSAYAARTNSFLYNGRLVLSTFGDNSLDWTNGVLSPLKAQGINVFFVPDFAIENGTIWSDPASGARDLLAKYGSFVDGLFAFASGLVNSITNINAGYLQACQSAGKLFMAAYSPTYWGCNQLNAGRPFFETQGGEGTIAQWNWILQNQPDWVELVTWNDLNESTYLAPLAQPDQYYRAPPARYSHAGYLELSKLFINAYKAGRPPTITNDTVFYFYRTHATNAVALNTNDSAVTTLLGPVQDVIFTTARLIAPAQLTLTSGNFSTNLSLPAGLTNVRLPWRAGSQSLSLRREGKLLVPLMGPDILSQVTNYDYFPASGYLMYPNPPLNLKVIGVH